MVGVKWSLEIYHNSLKFFFYKKYVYSFWTHCCYIMRYIVGVYSHHKPFTTNDMLVRFIRHQYDTCTSFKVQLMWWNSGWVKFSRHFWSDVCNIKILLSLTSRCELLHPGRIKKVRAIPGNFLSAVVSCESMTPIVMLKIIVLRSSRKLSHFAYYALINLFLLRGSFEKCSIKGRLTT